ncbi:vacuolar amino acid transporter 1-like [Pyrus ussuriensis x Pyrus communis]|uniref:Vacuolar amino acid transporter 1-like n=1 Tax=Pyrus ussuriensis x Pyrus communis TaxID=2448454 RepID=A0A5N5FMI0_9ROSA|nr:vacuolar amino acid transporter 1-like [Pyrus ussuriensis x Pyrus communis]
MRRANAHWCQIDIEMFLCTGVMGPGIALTLAKTAKVLLLSFIVCTASYASMAVLGYSMFGSRVESQITLNLPTQKLS